MSLTYSIGEMARAAGVAASTVRFYEREGLLRPDGRTEARYRVYGERSLERLRFIRAAQGSGLALDDVKRLLALQDGQSAPCREVQQLLECRLAEAERRLQDLRRVRAVLRTSISACRSAEASGCCVVLEDLKRGPLGRRTPSRAATKKKSKSAQP